MHESIEQEWLDWMRSKHIKEVLATKLFKSARLSKILSHQEPNQISYSVQYLCENQEKLKAYYQGFATDLRKESAALFKDKIHVFRTELELVEDFFYLEN